MSTFFPAKIGFLHLWPDQLSCFDVYWKQTDKQATKLNIYRETLNKEYIERIHQMSYSSLSDNGMLQIFSFLIK